MTNMSLLSLLGSRTRSKQNISTLSLQTEISHAGSSTIASPPTSPHLRKRLRKRPTLPQQQSTTKAEVLPRNNTSFSCSRGTLGGFCALDDLERQQTPHPEQSASVMKSMGRKIGLGLRLQIQNDSPADLSHVVDGTESWYLSYPPPTPTFPSPSTYSESEIEFVDGDPALVPVVEVYRSPASSADENDTASLRSASSTYQSSTSSSSIFVDNDLQSGGEIAVEALIISTQQLAEQYRALLSRAPTPGHNLLHLPLPSPLHSHPFMPSESDALAPLPLQISQHPNQTQVRKQKRPARRLSQKQPPSIPQRQHFKLSPSPQRTLRKMQARHSLHKFIDDVAVYELYEPFFKRSRLSECSTLVSSKENTPLPSPRIGTKALEAFPQRFDFGLGSISEKSKTPEIPIRSEKRPGLIHDAFSRSGDEHLRVPCEVYNYLGPTEKRMGGVEWEVWI